MKTIAFHSNQLSMQGTEVALFDYAHYNETILGNRSVIIHHSENPNNDQGAINKFKNRFAVTGYKNINDLDETLRKNKAELLYAIKAGRRDKIISRFVPTMVHAVFPTAPWQIHGNSYAFISEWLSRECSGGQVPAVPHIVAMPKANNNLRNELKIPTNALVLGCYGGSKSFDIECAIKGVGEVLKSEKPIYFIFMNLKPFIDHPRAIFLPGSTDIERKSDFINTCDAMVHARLQGESFGLSCGEFSVCNKPVLTYQYCKHKHHHEILGKKGFYYGNQLDFVNIVKGFDRIKLAAGNWDCYSERYNPEGVMQLFEKHLIYPALTPNSAKRPNTLAFARYIVSKVYK
jgi:hypothetical protein